MPTPPLDLDAVSFEDLKKLVVQLLVEVTALREENRQLREDIARLKDLPKKPQLAPGGMDKASEPDRRAGQAGQDQASAPAAAQAAERPAHPAGD